MIVSKNVKLFVVSQTSRKNEFPGNRATRRRARYHNRIVDKVNELRMELIQAGAKKIPARPHSVRSYSGYYSRLLGIARAMIAEV